MVVRGCATNAVRGLAWDVDVSVEDLLPDHFDLSTRPIQIPSAVRAVDDALSKSDESHPRLEG